MKISNYSLNYSELLSSGRMDILQFLMLCRELGLEGASLHLANLASTEPDYLKQVRRAYLDHGLSVAMFAVTTNFGRPKEQHEEEMRKARVAIGVAALLGAPLLRVFAGSPPAEGERQNAFDRAVAAVRQVCDEAAQAAVTVGLQNHNHGALVRTGDEVLRFMQKVAHPNLAFVLDTGQFAGSPGASGPMRTGILAPPGSASELNLDFLESMRQTASLARHVRVKFYNPRPDGSEPAINYVKVRDILQAVHYPGFLDVVYEPGKGASGPGEEVRSAVPRVVAFLRTTFQAAPGLPPRPAAPAGARYAGLEAGRYFVELQPRTETQTAFLEGPAADRQGNVFFTNMPADRILKWDPRQKRLEVFRERSNQANGLRFDRQGCLLACEGGGRVTRADMKSGQATVLADGYQGKPLGAPNDLDIDGRGRIYFTSRLANTDPKVGNVNAVYRIDPNGSVSRILAWPAIDMPNGIAVCPDDRILYLIDADGRLNRARRIRAYELKPNGTVGNERLLYDFYPGRSGDGMAVDAEGNLYVAAGLHRTRGTSETLDTRPGIHVISPQGRLLAFIETPEDTITNCTFGGADWRTLYITCGKLLLSLRARIPGKPSYEPSA